MTDRRQGRAAVASLVTAGAVLLAAGCGGSPEPPAHQTPAAAATAGLRALATRYLAIALPANRQLDHDFDGLKDNEGDNEANEGDNRDEEGGNLAAAQADLRAAAATERRFDRQLIAITFPPQTEPFVRLLYGANQARATLTTTAAAAASLRQLRGYQPRLDAANEPVEDAVRVIRSRLGLPPPDTS